MVGFPASWPVHSLPSKPAVAGIVDQRVDIVDQQVDVLGQRVNVVGQRVNVVSPQVVVVGQRVDKYWELQTWMLSS